VVTAEKLLEPADHWNMAEVPAFHDTVFSRLNARRHRCFQTAALLCVMPTLPYFQNHGPTFVAVLRGGIRTRNGLSPILRDRCLLIQDHPLV
jgi:hypothetical protein